MYERSKTIKYLSLCSGIEAASVAWQPLGWEAIGFAEIDAFPSAVLAYRFPDVTNYGDITKYEQWPDMDVDVVIGGTPCQSFSTEGKMEGLKDERGQVIYSYLGVVEQYKPRWVVWENVPGVLSSNHGRDFAEFLFGLEKCGYGWAYRILDAQYFGVPQRRRRVFVVGHLDNRTDLAAKVLFEHEGLRRNITESKSERQHIAARAGGSNAVLYTSHGQDARYHRADKIAYTVTAKYGTGGNNAPIVMSSGHGNAEIAAGKSTTLTCNHEAPIFCARQTLRRITPLECERLQGLPDNWTRIPWRNKPEENCPNSLRYKAIGNSMAVPVIRWIGNRISVEDKKEIMTWQQI